MELDLFAGLAVFSKLEFTFALDIHIYLIPLCNVVLAFTDRTN